MFDKEAIKALQEGAAISQAASSLKNAAHHIVALPSDYKLHDLEQHMVVRRHARGVMSTSDVSAFVAYTNKHCEDGATVFVSSDLKAVAILNLGGPETPGHADNKAVFQPEMTAAYKALLTMADGRGRSQKEVAEFIEDWTININCFDDDAMGPAIPNKQAIAAVRKITIESSREIASEEKQLGASKSTFESVQASSKNQLPTLLYFACDPYADIKERLFLLRLGVLTGEATPRISLRIIKAEQHQQDMAKELTEIVTNLLGDTTVLIGHYAKSP